MKTFDDNLIPLEGRSAHYHEHYAVTTAALHVSATDLVLVSRGSLALWDPFGVGDVAGRKLIASWGCSWAPRGRHTDLGMDYRSLAMCGSVAADYADAQ